LQNILESFKMFQNALEYSIRSQNILECPKIIQNILEHHKIFQDVPDYLPRVFVPSNYKYHPTIQLHPNSNFFRSRQVDSKYTYFVGVSIKYYVLLELIMNTWNRIRILGNWKNLKLRNLKLRNLNLNLNFRNLKLRKFIIFI